VIPNMDIKVHPSVSGHIHFRKVCFQEVSRNFEDFEIFVILVKGSDEYKIVRVFEVAS
jgi:hypothetical protein